jgi:hypothetical protein
MEAKRIASSRTRQISRYLGCVVLSMMLVLVANAQYRFSIPLTVTDGVDTYTLYFGIVPGANFCVVESDSVNGHAEYFLPPMPPSGVFDARLVWPRTGTNATCFDQGTLCDFRPYASMSQRDTFRIKAQLGSGSAMVVSWPSNIGTRFVGATIRFVGSNGAVNTDMMTNTSVDITDAGDPAVATIFTSMIIDDVVQNEAGLPMAITLEQNFPNPFNPATVIKYDLPKDSHVRLRIFDVLGREVETLVDGLERAGYKSVNWNGAGRASGVYFCKLEAGTFTAVRRMLLVK